MILLLVFHRKGNWGTEGKHLANSLNLGKNQDSVSPRSQSPGFYISSLMLPQWHAVEWAACTWEIYFFTVLNPESPSSMCQRVEAWWGLSSWLQTPVISLWTLTWWKQRDVSISSSSHKTSILWLHLTLLISSRHYLQTQHPWGLGLQHMMFRRHNSIYYILLLHSPNEYLIAKYINYIFTVPNMLIYFIINCGVWSPKSHLNIIQVRYGLGWRYESCWGQFSSCALVKPDKLWIPEYIPRGRIKREGTSGGFSSKFQT